MNKINLILSLFIFLILIFSCKQKTTEKTSEKFNNWEELEIETSSEKLTVSKFSDLADYVKDSNNITFKILPKNGEDIKEKIVQRKIFFSKSEKDSLAKFIYQSVTKPKFANVLATDYAGNVALRYNTGTTMLICKYNSVGD